MSEITVREAMDGIPEVQAAEDALYNALDAYGATKRTTYLISALIDAKVAEALEAMTDRIEQATGIRP